MCLPAEDMLRNMDLLCSFPAATQVYCGHEYTLANLTFLRSLAVTSLSDDAPDRYTLLRPTIEAYYQRAVTLRQANTPTLPSTILDELQYNLFAKCREAAVQEAMGCAGDPVATMHALRDRKNHF